MKKIIVLCFAFLAVSLGSVYAQEKTAKEIMKERKEIAKLSRSALNDKLKMHVKKPRSWLNRAGRLLRAHCLWLNSWISLI